MKLILFAKHLSGIEIDDLVKHAKVSGVDGFDFPIRHGYAVNVATAAAHRDGSPYPNSHEFDG